LLTKKVNFNLLFRCKELFKTIGKNALDFFFTRNNGKRGGINSANEKKDHQP
jgi:hypothetical protein